MDERPTTTITLPMTGAIVTLYTFLTTKQNRDLIRAAAKDIRVTLKPGQNKEEVQTALKQQDQELEGVTVFDLQDLALSYLVKEISTKSGEKVENPVDFINNLPSEDGDFVYEATNQFSKLSVLSDEAKKK